MNGLNVDPRSEIVHRTSNTVLNIIVPAVVNAIKTPPFRVNPIRNRESFDARSVDAIAQSISSGMLFMSIRRTLVSIRPPGALPNIAAIVTDASDILVK